LLDDGTKSESVLELFLAILFKRLLLELFVVVVVVGTVFESCDNVLVNENAFRRTDDGDVDDDGDEDELFSLFLLFNFDY